LYKREYKKRKYSGLSDAGLITVGVDRLVILVLIEAKVPDLSPIAKGGGSLTKGKAKITPRRSDSY
jgi:hypothetical protein